MIAKCSCQHCNGTIEFDTTELVEENSVVPCPHCGLETKLSVPTTATPKSASPQKTTPESKTESPKNIVANNKSEFTPKMPPSRRDSNHLLIFLQIMNLGALIFIAVIFWQGQQPKKIEYAEFSWDDSIHTPAIVYRDDKGVIEDFGSYPVTSRASALEVLSWDGWKLAWTDGSRYLITRPEGHWRHHYFDIEEYKP